MTEDPRLRRPPLELLARAARLELWRHARFPVSSPSTRECGRRLTAREHSPRQTVGTHCADANATKFVLLDGASAVLPPWRSRGSLSASCGAGAVKPDIHRVDP